MRLTKEDYMRLPKARLAELLVERDEEDRLSITTPAPAPITTPWTQPWNPGITYAELYARN